MSQPPSPLIQKASTLRHSSDVSSAAQTITEDGPPAIDSDVHPTRFERVTFAFGGQGSSKVMPPLRNVSRSIGALIPMASPQRLLTLAAEGPTGESSSS